MSIVADFEVDFGARKEREPVVSRNRRVMRVHTSDDDTAADDDDDNK
jgi:hypothetical protein